MIRLIGFDLDGTLLTPDKTVSAYTREILEECARKNILLVPVTGRPLHGIPEDVRSIPCLTYLICSNGAMTVNLQSGNIQRRRSMSADLVGDILRRIPMDTIREVFVAGYGYIDSVTAELWKKKDLIPALRRYLKESRRVVDHFTDFHDMISTLKPETREKFGITEEHFAESMYISSGDVKTHRMILDAVKDLSQKCHIIESASTAIEFGALDADKGKAFLDLADACGVKRSETAAFGDGGNDIDLLKSAGTAVAMGNAIPRVKEAADFVTEDNEHDGVAKGIQRLGFYLAR